MRRLADGVWQLELRGDGVNAYLLEDVLIDSGLVLHRADVLAELAGSRLAAHAITHAHLDHYGASGEVRKRFGVPVLCGAADAPLVAAGKMAWPGGLVLRSAPRCPVDRALHEGDELAGFRVLETPGHSDGHISFWRESDRVLVCGDVIWGRLPFVNLGRPREPFARANPDPVRNHASALRLAELEPNLVCFGHGPPLRDPARFAAIVGGRVDDAAAR